MRGTGHGRRARPAGLGRSGWPGWRGCRAPEAPAQPQQPVAQAQRQQHQRQAGPEHAVLRRHRRQRVLQQLEDDGARDAAMEPARAADHQHQQHVGRTLEGQDVKRGETGGLGQQRAGRAGHPGGDGVGDGEMARRRNADGLGAPPVVADRPQRDAEGRTHQPAQRHEQQQRDRQRIPGRRAAIEIEGEATGQRAHRHALQAVGAAGHAGQGVGEFEQQRGGAQRHHQARQVAAAQHARAGEGAAAGRQRRRQRQAGQRVGRQVLGAQSRRVGADAEERRVAQRHDAGIPEDEIEREREQRDDGDLAHQRRLQGQHGGQRQGQGPGRDLPGPPPARRPSPGAHGRPPAANRPRGRHISSAIISR